MCWELFKAISQKQNLGFTKILFYKVCSFSWCTLYTEVIFVNKKNFPSISFRKIKYISNYKKLSFSFFQDRVTSFTCLEWGWKRKAHRDTELLLNSRGQHSHYVLFVPEGIQCGWCHLELCNSTEPWRGKNLQSVLSVNLSS